MVRATKVASAPMASDSGRSGLSMRALRARLGARAEPRGRRILALGQAVDLVVEQDDLQIDVAADGVDQVVAADGQAVAVAGDDPDVQVGPGQLQAGGEGRRPAVDGVEAVGVHVVGEAAGAADAGDEHDLLARHAEAGQRLLHLGEDGVVAAARAPADFLVAGEVLGGQRGRDVSVDMENLLEDRRCRINPGRLPASWPAFVRSARIRRCDRARRCIYAAVLRSSPRSR